MSGARLHTLLPELATRQPVMVIGAAVIDVIADAYALPWRGCDIELKQQSVNVGGCALNIAVALKRLGIEAGNALPLGQGVWAEIIRNRMAKEGLISLIDNAEGDNGWCLALVEPDGERTFMSFSGVENQWNRQWLARLTVAPGSLLYFSGYQLASPCGELLVESDVVLHYPDHKDVIIDSKASLTAFINYVNAETDDERRKALDEHVKSVRRHVDELSAKNYAKYSMEGGTTLDFVIMFVPQEAAMQLAVSADPSLWNYAFERKVVITGEQNLFSLLRLLQIAWTQQRQADNQELVFGLADTLIERVGLFVERFEKIGKNIETVQKSFDDARKAIKGNQSFIVSARKLVEMGAKENPRRPLPDISPDDDSQA